MTTERNVRWTFGPVTRRSVVPAVTFGVAMGVLQLFFQASLATLVFNGRLEPFVGVGIGMFLFGTVCIALIVGLATESIPITAYVQEAPVAILGVIIAAVLAEMTAAPDDVVFATVAATMIVATVFTGVCFWLLGRFHLGKLVRFIPYPVGGGFLAGTGWLLIVGGIDVASRADPGTGLLAADELARWAPAAAFGLALLLTLHRYSHAFVIPALVLAGIIAFHVVHRIASGGAGDAEADGWLIGPIPDGRLWEPVIDDALTRADWGVVFGQALGMGAIVVVSVVSMLLNLSGFEMSTRRDVDLDAELRNSGVANVVAGSGGSPVGFIGLGVTVLGHRLHVRSRLAGVVSATVMLLALLFGADVLSLVPRAIAGGFLVYLGLGFFADWLYATWGKMPLVDYLLIWVILVATATIGFLEAVGVGIVIAAVLFLVDYSRTDVVRHAASRREFASATVRPELYEQLLTERGDRLLIVTLQGHLFFGTAHRLVEDIRRRCREGAERRLEFVVLDFRLISGLDSSSAFSFVRLRQTTDRDAVTVVLTGLDEALLRQIRPALDAGDDAETHEGAPPSRWLVRPTLDEGVAWCEQRMIDRFESVGLRDAPRSLFDLVRAAIDDTTEEVDWLDRLDPTVEIGPGGDAQAFAGYVERVPFRAGDTLAEPAQPIDALRVLAAGEATYETVAADGSIVDHGALDTGSDLDAAAFYAGRTSGRRIVASSNGTLEVISSVALERMTAEHPHIAATLHLTVAAQLGRRAERLADTTRGLQR